MDLVFGKGLGAVGGGPVVALSEGAAAAAAAGGLPEIVSRRR